MAGTEFDALRTVVGGHGSGVVARFPGVLCVAVADDQQPLQRLLELCLEVAGPSPGRVLARRLAAWLSGPDAPPDTLQFGTVSAAGERMAVFLVGGVAVTAQESGTKVSGADSAAWADRLLDGTDVPLMIAVDGAAVPDDPFAGVIDLRLGVVPGGAAMLAPAGAGVLASASIAVPAHVHEHGRPAFAPAAVAPPDDIPTGATEPVIVPVPPSPTEPPPEPPPPRRADNIFGVVPEEERAPLDVGAPASAGAPRAGRAPTGKGPAAAQGAEVGADAGLDAGAAAEVDEGPQTRGHLCSRGHLNDPRSHFCVLCGIRMNERTGVLVLGQRPPLGLLVLDDGATYTVDAEYLIGRMPDVDERVRGGSFRPIVVEDSSGAVSRVHGELRVDGWDVVLVDSGSRNGTYVAAPGTTSWTQVPSGQSHKLVPGTRVRMGGRTMVFESPSGVR